MAAFVPHSPTRLPGVSAPAPASAPLQRLSRSAFTPTAPSSSSSRPARPAPRAAAPVMVLGLRRIFAPSTRVKPEQAVPVVAPPPPPVLRDAPVAWAKAHPLQAAAMMSVVWLALQRVVGLVRGQQTKDARGRTGAGAATTGGAAAAATATATDKSGALRARAVPRRHETTEEALDLLGNTARKYIIVGGKGGVGKTSMSAAVATTFADRGQTTLIISTDPAHSLSDAFGQSVSGGDPVPVSGIDNLYAQEVDPEQMKRTFKTMSNMGGGASGMGGMGMEDMGLDELNSLFDTIPPGFDEAVALVEIVKYIEADSEYARYERIVFDTAPTGHTLRLLALPDFLNGFFGKIISMKSKFGNVMSQLKGMFGNDADVDNSVQEMEELKRAMSMVRDLFRDEVQTEFIVATIPNMMAIAESKRLVQELQKEEIPVRHLFVNQVQPSNDECIFCAARHKEQCANLKYIEREMSGLAISTVQSFDKEIQGAAALRAMGAQLFPKSIEGADQAKEGSSTREDQPGGPGSGGGSSSPPRAEAELVE